MSQVAFWLAKLTYEISTTKWPISSRITFHDKDVYRYFKVYFVKMIMSQVDFWLAPYDYEKLLPPSDQ